MRVTLVSETYFPQVNGVSRTLGQLVRVLREAGDTVQLIHPDYGGAGDPGPSRRVRSVPVPFYPELRLPVPPFGSALRAIDAFAPELIHVATEATLGLTVLWHARARHVPVVSSFHTNFDQYTEHYKIGWTRGLLWRYLRWFHNRTIETYVPSRSTISALEAEGLERLVLWPRGVDGRLFRPDRPGRDRIRQSLGFGPDDVVVGHVSRIAAEKNVDYLAEALELVSEARPSVRILIVGDGPARPDIERRLAGRAVFAGYRSGDDLADHYAACDLFAFASRTETFGNVILEAMSSGLPVVAVRAGGPGDVVRDGETGLLVDPDDPPSTFADRLLGLIDDPAARLALARRAREYAASQTWDAIMTGLRERYLAIVNRASVRPPSLAAGA